MYSSKLHYTTLPPQVTQQLPQLLVFVNIAGFQAGDLHFWVTRLLTLGRVSIFFAESVCKNLKTFWF